MVRAELWTEEMREVWERMKGWSNGQIAEFGLGCAMVAKDAAPYLEAPERARAKREEAKRSAGMRCRTCMYYVHKQAEGEAMVTADKGRCRRHAPTMGGFPVVFPSDWCGDHKLG